MYVSSTFRSARPSRERFQSLFLALLETGDTNGPPAIILDGDDPDAKLSTGTFLVLEASDSALHAIGSSKILFGTGAEAQIVDFDVGKIRFYSCGVPAR